MKRLAALGLAAVLVSAVGGCWNLQWTSLDAPGPAPLQQGRAQQYDPYPEMEPAPGFDGGRPRDYNQPPAQVDKARRHLRSLGQGF